MKYRIPWHMFFRWFIPYPAWQSALMAFLLVLPYQMAILTHSMAMPARCFGVLLGSVAAAAIHSYHRRVPLRELLFLTMVNVTTALLLSRLFWGELDRGAGVDSGMMALGGGWLVYRLRGYFRSPSGC